MYCTYLHDVADVDIDAAVDGLRRYPLAVLEDLEAPDPDAVLEDEGDAVAVLVRAEAVVPLLRRREVVMRRHEVEAAVAVVIPEEARRQTHALVQDVLEEQPQLGELDVTLLHYFSEFVRGAFVDREIN